MLPDSAPRFGQLISLSVIFLAGILLATQPASHATEAEEDVRESALCRDCHEDVVDQFRLTAHATAGGWDPSKACSSCHGPGETHSESMEVKDIVRLKALLPRESSKTCLSCHTGHTGFRFRQSLHSLKDVGCIECHNPHSTKDHMLTKTGVTLCAECHQGILAQFELPRSHPLGDGVNGCADCHNPHGSKNARNLRSFGNDNCATCHFEYAGPFLYSHDVGSIDGCQTCHSVHGTPNRHLLTDTRQFNLCYQCHSAATTPDFHSTAFVNEKCTACHTAIHGSNTNPFFLEE